MTKELQAGHDVVLRQMRNRTRKISRLAWAFSLVCEMFADSANAVTGGCEAVVEPNPLKADMIQ